MNRTILELKRCDEKQNLITCPMYESDHLGIKTDNPHTYIYTANWYESDHLGIKTLMFRQAVECGFQV